MFVLVQNTVVEPGWRGYLTLELTRFLPWPIRLRCGMPIAQILFKQLDQPTEQPYAGRYQDQERRPQSARFATDEDVKHGRF
jgi:dCTP deaminase